MRARELRALLHKSWLETRWVFALAMIILLAFSLWSVVRFPDAVRSGVRDMQLHNRPNAALRGIVTYTQVEIFEKLTLLWGVLSVMLGAGGLLRERILGTAPFLLSLPGSRRRLVAVRCAMGILQATCLALAAYAIVPLAFRLTHQSYSFGLALGYASILAVSGVSFVAYGILISVILDGGSWTGIIGSATAFLALIMDQLMGRITPTFASYAPFRLLSGESYFRHAVVPWTGISISVAVAAAMLGFALWLVKWQDF
jgi:hypothetical protein